MFGRLKVGPGRYTDGVENVSPRGGNSGEVMVSQLMPPRLEMALRFQSYIYHVASQAFLLIGGGVGAPTWINPIGSGVLFVPLRLSCSFISGTTTIGSVIWAKQVTSGAGTSGGVTGGNPLTATFVAPIACRVNSAGSPRVLFSPTTSTWTTAPTAVMATGINLGTAAPIVEGPLVVDYNGEIVCEPGNTLALDYTVTTSTSVWQITVVGAEVPFNQGQ